MQGGNREPREIKAVDEGPNMGFTTGYSEDGQLLPNEQTPEESVP